ncbi:VOC family protein [soil metagenome]
MQVNAYLNFNGNCAEAFRFYAELFKAKIDQMMTHKDIPPGVNMPNIEQWRDKVLHVSLKGEGFELAGSDTPPAYYEKPQGMVVSIGVTDPKEAERLFTALSEKGSVRMPLEKTFWAQKYGMCTDRFGIPWMINCP